MIDFNNLINNYLKRELRIKTIGRYYPSEAGSCLRKVYYSYKIPKETEQDLIKIFQVGHMFHDFIEDVLKSEKTPEIELLESEVPFKIEEEGFIISGRIDNIILVKLDNKKVLLEIKSTSSLKYTEEPNDRDVMQLQLYMHHTKIHNGMILYLEKNTLQAKWFNVDYNENIAGETIERFKILDKYLVNNQLPEPEARIDIEKEWMCKNCNYREECYRDTPSL